MSSPADTKTGKKRLQFRSAEKKVDVFGHDDVAHDLKAVVLAGGFKGGHEPIASHWGVQVREPVMATEGDEVVVALLLVSVETGGMVWIVRLPTRFVGHPAIPFAFSACMIDTHSLPWGMYPTG